MGRIGVDTELRELDFGDESVRREVLAMLPEIARFPLRAGGLPAARWFEQFDEEEPNYPTTVEDLLALATYSVTSGRELQVHASPERCFDAAPPERPDRGLLVIDLHLDNWVVPVTLEHPDRVLEPAEGRLTTFVDPDLDVTRWGARPRTRTWLTNVYQEWHIDHRLEMPLMLRELDELVAWEERLEHLFPLEAAEIPRASDLEAYRGPERWAEQRWEAVTGEEVPGGPTRWTAGPEEEERELLIGALADYARGVAASSLAT